MFSNFYQLDLHNKNFVALANQESKLQDILDQESDLAWYSHGYDKCVLVDLLIDFISPPNHVCYWV